MLIPPGSRSPQESSGVREETGSFSIEALLLRLVGLTEVFLLTDAAEDELLEIGDGEVEGTAMGLGVEALGSLAYITRTFQSAKALQEATVMKRFG